ncbi:MAG: hypothetical protein ACPG5U_08760 [Planktomarina sp.]|uniref:hypothetical protein n=1 Tax=Halocynthiibacter sp. TaxID=1979210 RepID=UPI003C5C5885
MKSILLATAAVVCTGTSATAFEFKGAEVGLGFQQADLPDNGPTLDGNIIGVRGEFGFGDRFTLDAGFKQANYDSLLPKADMNRFDFTGTYNL